MSDQLAIVKSGSRKCNQRKGFTLVELLVVIGIIAVLISILLPSLNRARQTANSVKCLANLSQIGLGMKQYINDYKGRLMPLQDKFVASGNGANWASYLIDLKYIKAGKNSSSNNVFLCPTGSDLLNANVFAAPASSTADMGYARFRNANFAADPSDMITTNYMVNGVPASGASWWDSTRPYTEFFPFVFLDPAAAIRPTFPNMFHARNSTQLFLVADGAWCMNLNPSNFTWRHGNQSAALLDRQCNMVFCDGHAESIGGKQLPLVTDNLYNSTELDTGKGVWAIRLLAKPRL